MKRKISMLLLTPRETSSTGQTGRRREQQSNGIREEQGGEQSLQKIDLKRAEQRQPGSIPSDRGFTWLPGQSSTVSVCIESSQEDRNKQRRKLNRV